MLVENVMYFALGLLAAGLVALMIMPAIWQRAVRLTKKRIEAATPMSMAEFRADKDQLRAEFALSTRRLEMQVEALRKRLAEQLREINRKKGDLAAIKGERDNHLTIIREHEEREAELRRRVLELEKESADISQRLRMRDRELAEKASQLDAAREAQRQKEGQAAQFDGKVMSGDYAADTERLLATIATERERVRQLDEQNSGLAARLEATEREAARAAETRTLRTRKDDMPDATNSELAVAEARIANAESRLNTLLEETAGTPDGPLLADQLAEESETAALKDLVRSVEETVLADWDSERVDHARLRERMDEIAAEVGRIAAGQGRRPADSSASLFEQVQRFAGGPPVGSKIDQFPLRTALEAKQAAPRGEGAGAAAERLAAVREIQSRN